MIKDLIRRHKRKKRQIHHSVAAALARHIDAEGVVTVNQRLMDTLGAGRTLLFRVAYQLVIRERVAMLADTDGQVLLMTKSRYRDLIAERAGKPVATVAAAAMREEVALAVPTLMGEEVLAICEDTVPIEAVGVEMVNTLIEDDDSIAYEVGAPAEEMAEETLVNHDPVPVLDAEADLDWFSLDVATAGNGQEVLSDFRQTLPDRPRDPWPAKEEVGIDLDFFQK